MMGWVIPFVAGWGLGAVGTLVAVALARAAGSHPVVDPGSPEASRRCVLS